MCLEEGRQCDISGALQTGLPLGAYAKENLVALPEVNKNTLEILASWMEMLNVNTKMF